MTDTPTPLPGPRDTSIEGAVVAWAAGENNATAVVTVDDNGWTVKLDLADGGIIAAAPRLAAAIALFNKQAASVPHEIKYQFDPETNACFDAWTGAEQLADQAVADALDFKRQYVRRLMAMPGASSADVAELLGLSTRAINALLG